MERVSPPAASPARKIVRLWQSHNQRRWRDERDVLARDERAPFVCECTSAECLMAVELTMREYEEAHMGANWYAVYPGHILPDDGGRVVARHPHHWVVELAPLRSAGRPPGRGGLTGGASGTI
jgi:hypothetical protein